MDDSQKFRMVNSVKILDVLTDHGVSCSGTGDNLMAVSPFRKTSNKTSFTISISRNTFKDWKLDYGGGPVKFIMKLKKLDAKNAIDYLYNVYFNGNAPVKELFIPPVIEERAALDKDVLHVAYSIFLDLCSLTEEDKKYLKNVRGLSDEEILDVGFKSFPRRTIRHTLQERLIEAGINPTDIPGFFRYSDDECITFNYYVGILIPIRDIFGRIVGLQIRKRNLKSELDNRYVWLSSAFAMNKPGSAPKYFCNGRGPEAPLGFVEGTFSCDRVTTLFVTEGFFKAFSIRKNVKSPSITVQGVTNWKGINDVVEELTKRYPKLNRIIFTFDADFIGNLNVSNQLCKMYNSLKPQFPGIEFRTMLWDINLGKGIDDLIANVKTLPGNMHLMDMDSFESAFKEFEPVGRKMAEEEVDEDVFMSAYKEVLDKWRES